MSISKDYKECPICEVWIPKKNYKQHKGSKRCKELADGKARREESKLRALNKINKMFY